MSRIPLSRMPDPCDRTPNQPAVLLQPDDIRSIGDARDVVPPLTKEPERWQAYTHHVINKARELGWSEIKLMGKQILLIANVHVVEPAKREQMDG